MNIRHIINIHLFYTSFISIKEKNREPLVDHNGEHVIEVIPGLEQIQLRPEQSPKFTAIEY